MGEKDRGLRRVRNVAGGVFLGLAFLAADSGVVAPIVNSQNVFRPNPSQPVAADVIKISEPAPIELVDPSPTSAPEAIPSPVPTQEPIITNMFNSFWMPDIPKLDKPINVNHLGCNEGVIPDKSMEVWSSGCAGPNNLFIMAHADGAFGPLREAYNAQKLRIGEIAYYTDAVGQLYAYEVVSVDHPTTTDWGKGSSWAGTSTMVMTLDTCDDGPVKGDSAYRIIVRLVPTQIPSDWQQTLAEK